MQKYADVFVLLAGVLWGLVGPVVKSLRDLGLTSIQISALRWIFAGILMIAIVFILDKKLLKIHIRDIWWFFCTGVICILLSSTLYFVTMPLASVAVANVLMYTSPVWIMIFAVILFGEKITRNKVLALLLAFFGCILITGILNPGGFAVTLLGLFTGLGSGLLYGLYSIFGKFVLKKYDSITVTLYTAAFAGFGALFIIDIPQTFNLISGNINIVTNLALIVFVMTIAPYTLYTLGLKNTLATRASIFSCIEPMTSALVGTIFMQEPFSIFQFAGIVMILAAGLITQLKK
ncbi:MAG: DMT family transporter [Clostridia bacterium]|nr:DMT family transporter [Clostridia bacterium]